MRITVLSNLETNEFFFSKDHLQQNRSRVPLSERWVPITYTLPHFANPRPGLEDAYVRTREDVVRIYHGDQKEILNPDPAFQA